VSDGPQDSHDAYWRTNLRYVGVLLAIWFAVSLLGSVLLVDVLDQVSIFGFKLGFWLAQQGSIFTFVILIFVYAWLMNRLDKRHGLDD
jgi:putative solute:sodium symporter small subunit